jgi:hypothetical protein
MSLLNIVALPKWDFEEYTTCEREIEPILRL